MAAPFNVPLPNPGDKPWNLNPAIQEVRSRLGTTEDLTTTGRLSEANLNTTIGQATLRRNSIVLFGDSRTDDADFGSPSGPNYYSTNMSWFDWGNAAREGGPVLTPIYKGITGNTTAQMLARFEADVLTPAPGYVTIWGGTNDAWASLSNVDASYDRMKHMVEAAVAKGIHVFLISETTAATGAFGKTADFAKFIVYYNERLRALAAATPGVDYWDFNQVILDPASVAAQPKAGMLRDGLHLTPYGASRIGVDIVGPALSKLPGRLVSLVNSQMDNRQAYAGSNNLMFNGLMLNNSGTPGGGHTGSLPNGWSSNGNTATLSIPDRADGVGRDIRVQIAASAAGNLFLLRQMQIGLVVPGKAYQVEAEVNVVAATGIGSISSTVVATVSGTSYRFGWGYETQSMVTTDQIAPGKYTVRSVPFMIPAGTVSNFEFQFRVGIPSAAAVADIRLGRVAVREVPSL